MKRLRVLQILNFWLNVGTERVSFVATVSIQSEGGKTSAEDFVSWDGNALY